MSTYDPRLYRQFAENLRAALNGPNVRRMEVEKLRKLALGSAVRTKFGSYCWRSAISSRIAEKTVYLGSEAVQLPKLNDAQKRIVEGAPDELHKVLQLMRILPFVHVRRQMGDNPEFNPALDLYVSVADPKNYRLPFMWGHTMRAFDARKPGPVFTMIHIPDEHPLRMQVLSLPEHDINIALGTDYTGEEKKGFLRQGMFRADQRNMLGLHAGTKIVRVRDALDGKLKEYGVFVFGLTATGKSTWACHQLGLDPSEGEETFVAQDDIVFLRRDGSAYGTEVGFYVKTDVAKESQEAMYYALTDESALLENVMVEADGSVNFLDERLGENGRAVIRRDKLRVARGRKLHCISADSIDLPSLDRLDGLIFAFITRRNTILPFAQELTPEQAVLAYLWGESTHSFATRPELAGESVHIVGTDDFIVGPRGRKVNYFYEVIMDLADRFPGKLRFYQYNTGGIGEKIETSIEGSVKRKKLVRKAERVPINVMAAIQRGDLRRTNRYVPGRLGTNELVSCDGVDLRAHDPRRYYSEAEIDGYVRDIVAGRRKFTEEIAAEGLKPEIVKLAEQAFECAKGQRAEKREAPTPREPAAAAKSAPDAAERGRPPFSPWITPYEPRPPRDFRGRRS